jgi:Histidine kinase
LQQTFKYKLLIHVAGWITFFVVPLLLSPIHDFAANLKDPANLISMLIRNFLWMGLFYINLLYFTPVLLKNKGVLLFLFASLGGIILVTLVNSRIHHFFSPPLDFNPDRHFPGPPPDFGSGPPPGDGFRPGPPPNNMMPAGPLFSNFLISLMIVSIGTSIVLWSDWVKTKAAEQERAFQKVASELAVLKLQISPHFLFNTLNNIRWLIRSGSGQAEAAMVKLSQLLRYVLYQVEQEKVSLDKEIEHLKEYIDLQQMRLVNTQALNFSSIGYTQGKMLIPLLLIPLVENVFKYGEFKDTFQNQIHLTTNENILVFKTVNLVLGKSAEEPKREYGIGLSNVKKRLELHYPDKHILTSSEENGIFELELEIILN